MRIPVRAHRVQLDDDGATLAAMAACGLVGVLAAAAVTMDELLAVLHPLLPYMY